MSSLLTSEKIISIAEKIVFYGGIFILIAGIIGNSLNIILFTNLRSLKTKACGFYFLIESMINLGQIFIGIIIYIIENSFKINISIDSIIWCKIKTTIIQCLHLIFLSNVCLAAFDQFLSTHYLYNLRRMSTKKLAQNLLLCSICLVIIHMILSLIFFERSSQFFGCIIYNSIVASYFIYFYYLILIGLLPIIITITFSLLAFYNVRHIVRHQIPTERRRFDRQLTAMTFAHVIAFVSFGLPYIIFRIYSVKTPIIMDYSQRFAIEILIGSITGFLAYVNYVMSFYVFLISSSRFRHQIKHILMKKYWRSLKRLYKKNLLKINDNQIVPEASLPSVSIN